jgi:hypothetical protein
MTFVMKQLKNGSIKIEKAEPNEVKCEYAYTGGKIKVNTLHKMIKNGYQKNPKNTDNIDGYNLDKELSGKRVQTYYNPENDHLVINHRGTSGLQDVITDMRLMMNDKSSRRFQHSKKNTDEALKKYDTQNVTHLGHSLGAKLANESNRERHEEIAINPAVIPDDLLQKQKSNEVVIRSSLDPISALHSLRPFKSNSRTINIKPESLNLLKEHNSDILTRLDPKAEVGV